MMSEGDAIIERMYECMDLFSEATNAWFKHAFNAPTEAQRLAWPAIRSGENVLVVAPTGSGKTLCAFLSAIDRLMTKGGDGLLRTSGGGDGTAESDCNAKKRKPVRGVKVLYISPLKALGVDVAKNLQAPLAGIAGQCEAMGLPSPKVSVSIRSGDTTPQERRRIVSHPPDILVTTPESLFLLLTSKARRILSAVDTVIVDEVHAIAGSKRGAHLALSLERLESLAGRSVQRIGAFRHCGTAGRSRTFPWRHAAGTRHQTRIAPRHGSESGGTAFGHARSRLRRRRAEGRRRETSEPPYHAYLRGESCHGGIGGT